MEDFSPQRQESAGSAFLRGDLGPETVPAPLVLVYTLGLLEPNILAKASLRV